MFVNSLSSAIASNLVSDQYPYPEAVSDHVWQQAQCKFVMDLAMFVMDLHSGWLMKRRAPFQDNSSAHPGPRAQHDFCPEIILLEFMISWRFDWRTKRAWQF